MADIKERIAKLLALAESPEPEEAKAALLKARELMALHKMKTEDIERKKEHKVIKRATGITYTTLRDPWAAELSCLITSHYCCRATSIRMPGEKTHEIGIVGLDDDIEICEKVFRYAHNCVISETKRIGKEHKWFPAKYVRLIKNSYGEGFIRGLEKLYEIQDEKNQEWGIILVTPREIEDEINKLKKTRFSYESTRETDYFWKGKKDGTNFHPEERIDG